ncbi:MAG: GxxExxY protein [Phenylobacterium sp.]|uniref:GxxExxY protein n=1 Tax=Phenylobacterium sp. TaxID=1871053 RepID=UPI001A5DD60C|nr:GxxExxY protein [Phenylobacterium sp.]MBL8556604.1 GxxExxY protein [Phenylobacterium sp.]
MDEPSGKLLYQEEAFRIRGVLFHVYRSMGAGFLEAVYQECLGLEFARRGIPFVAEQTLGLIFDGVPLKQTYKADFVCFDRIVVEVKATRTIAPEHRAQLINYLRATGMSLGLLVNFGATRNVEIERFALTRPLSANSAFSAV